MGGEWQSCDLSPSSQQPMWEFREGIPLEWVKDPKVVLKAQLSLQAMCFPWSPSDGLPLPTPTERTLEEISHVFWRKDEKSKRATWKCWWVLHSQKATWPLTSCGKASVGGRMENANCRPAGALLSLRLNIPVNEGCCRGKRAASQPPSLCLIQLWNWKFFKYLGEEQLPTKLNQRT